MIPVTSTVSDPYVNKERTIVVSEPTSTGTTELRYWFDPDGILSALETSERRC
jgi:hypothetical protein